MPHDGLTLPRTTSLPKIPVLPSASPEIDPVSESSPSPAATSSEGQSSCSGTENTECVVCGDKSSGKHYGQYSCEGCKSFFKRSIRRALSYTCRGSKQCPVDVHHRNQCQYCRLRKCVKMGMRKEAVQRGRVPPPTLPFAPFFPLIHGPLLNPLMASFFRPETRTLPPVDSSDATGEFGAQLLFSVIDWTKQLPFFAELCLSDQIILLQNSWSQLFMLCASQSPIPPQVAAGIANPRLKPESSKTDAQDDAASFQAQLELIRGLHLDVVEMNCVKAAILFNPDTSGLIDKQKVESVQEKIQASLDDYCRSHKALMTGRFGRILLRLPAVRSFSQSVVERLFFSGLPSPVSVVVKDLLQQPAVPRFPLLNPFFQLPLPFIG